MHSRNQEEVEVLHVYEGTFLLENELCNYLLVIMYHMKLRDVVVVA